MAATAIYALNPSDRASYAGSDLIMSHYCGKRQKGGFLLLLLRKMDVSRNTPIVLGRYGNIMYDRGRNHH